jgi:hypothetical protein
MERMPATKESSLLSDSVSLPIIWELSSLQTSTVLQIHGKQFIPKDPHKSYLSLASATSIPLASIIADLRSTNKSAT